MVGELQETEGTGELLKIAEARYGKEFNRLFGLRPENNNPYEGLSRKLVYNVVRARLDMLRTAKGQMSVGEQVAPEIEEPLADCERALDVVEGKVFGGEEIKTKRKSPRGLERVLDSLASEAKKEANRQYNLDMLHLPSIWKVWRSYDREKGEYQARMRQVAFTERRKKVVSFVTDNMGEWIKSGDWSPAASE